MNKLQSALLATSLTCIGVWMAGADVEPAIISEIHTITKVTETEIYGENTYSGGEGIYYDKQTLSNYTDDTFEVGDRVEIQWTEEAFAEEDWESLYSIRVID